MFAYFDCFAGISGDMTLGAFISLGVPAEWLENELSRVLSKKVRLSVETIFRGGISACGVQVGAEDDHASRNYRQIKALIDKSALDARVKKISLDIFNNLLECRIQFYSPK